MKMVHARFPVGSVPNGLDRSLALCRDGLDVDMPPSLELEPGAGLFLDRCHNEAVVELAKPRIANDKGEFDIRCSDFRNRLFDLGNTVAAHDKRATEIRERFRVRQNAGVKTVDSIWQRARRAELPGLLRFIFGLRNRLRVGSPGNGHPEIHFPGIETLGVLRHRHIIFAAKEQSRNVDRPGCNHALGDEEPWVLAVKHDL